MDIPRRSKGPAGGFRLQAQDRAGLLTLDMRINPAASTYNAQLSYQFNDQVLPKDAVPVLALCDALVPASRWQSRRSTVRSLRWVLVPSAL
jgi:hypothetical protein